MRVVLADIDAAGMDATAALLPSGTESFSVQCDVSDSRSVEDLALYQRIVLTVQA
jgi:hypothetical protein